eukprot:8729981-Pyramimonas_sp.AAC.1
MATVVTPTALSSLSTRAAAIRRSPPPVVINSMKKSSSIKKPLSSSTRSLNQTMPRASSRKDASAGGDSGSNLPYTMGEKEGELHEEEDNPIEVTVPTYALLAGTESPLFHGEIRISSGKTGMYPTGFDERTCYAEIEMHPTGHLPEERDEFSLRDFLKYGQLVLGQEPSAWDRYHSAPYVSLGDSPAVLALAGKKVNIRVTGHAFVVEDRPHNCRRAVLPVNVHLVDEDVQVGCPERDGIDGCTVIIGRQTVLFDDV